VHVDFKTICSDGRRLPGRRTSSNMQWVVAPWDLTELLRSLMTSCKLSRLEASCGDRYSEMVQTGEIVGTGTAPHWVV
jgi:hypothetical protein